MFLLVLMRDKKEAWVGMLSCRACLTKREGGRVKKERERVRKGERVKEKGREGGEGEGENPIQFCFSTMATAEPA